MTYYNLFLDDLRKPSEAFDYTKDSRFNLLKWKKVRNYEEFVSIITEKYLDDQFPELVAFDHDLGTEHYISDDDIDYSSFIEKTGYDCAKWLIDFCIDKELKFPQYIVHSMNPVGKLNIINLIQNYQCQYCAGEGYHKKGCYKEYLEDEH